MIVVIYPGSFDPVTNGHRDIIDRASRVFSKVIVTVLDNPRKAPMFSIEERVEMLKLVVKNYPNVEVDSFQGLLVDYAKMKQTKVMLKGLRPMGDFDFEFQMAITNRQLDPELETLFMATTNRYSYISSSVVKEVGIFGGDISEFVPPEIYELVMKKVVTV
ncbi:MAG TPA: pantetheine-phosphate adenylyltransferase [Oscillospiraceae bacterium]|nr:pantetheine-phosphate adenylyltransferase [Oscillospiraceae bacterium]